jgi:hypothetical protein
LFLQDFVDVVRGKRHKSSKQFSNPQMHGFLPLALWLTKSTIGSARATGIRAASAVR